MNNFGQWGFQQQPPYQQPLYQQPPPQQQPQHQEARDHVNDRRREQPRDQQRDQQQRFNNINLDGIFNYIATIANQLVNFNQEDKKQMNEKIDKLNSEHFMLYRDNAVLNCEKHLHEEIMNGKNILGVVQNNLDRRNIELNRKDNELSSKDICNKIMGGIILFICAVLAFMFYVNHNACICPVDGID